MMVQMTDIVAGLFAISGAPLSEESPGHFAWDGQTFRLGGVNTYGRLHELSHWLIATEEERALPEFGLGTSPWYGTLEAPDTATWNDDRDSWNMEHRASLLGILFMKRLGLDWAQVAKSHGWDDLMWGGETRRRQDMKWLRGRNLLTPNGRPTLLQGVRVR